MSKYLVIYYVAKTNQVVDLTIVRARTSKAAKAKADGPAGYAVSAMQISRIPVGLWHWHL